MQVTVKANFNKQTKDSKKELVQFYVKGEDERKQELNDLCRDVVELSIEGVEQTLTAEFNKISKDSNKTTLDFIIKGDTSAAQSFEFYRMAGSTVNLTITESQMSIEEFAETRKGVSGRINGDGTVDVDENQQQLDFDSDEDVDIDDEDDLPM